MIRLASSIVWRRIGETIFIVDTKKNILYELNETASFIFEKVLEGKREDEIVSEMESIYEVDKEELEADVKDLINEFYQEGFYER